MRSNSEPHNILDQLSDYNFYLNFGSIIFGALGATTAATLAETPINKILAFSVSFTINSAATNIFVRRLTNTMSDAPSLVQSVGKFLDSPYQSLREFVDSPSTFFRQETRNLRNTRQDNFEQQQDHLVRNQ